MFNLSALDELEADGVDSLDEAGVSSALDSSAVASFVSNSELEPESESESESEESEEDVD